MFASQGPTTNLLSPRLSQQPFGQTSGGGNAFSSFGNKTGFPIKHSNKSNNHLSPPVGHNTTKVNNNKRQWASANMDASTQENGKTSAADRAKRFGSTSKSVVYDNFKKSRIQERQQAIRHGLIPDPENPTRLEDAVDFRGICQTKCPEFELIEREIQNGLDTLEMDEEGNAHPDKAVKAYRRSAAGLDQPLPSDVRTPATLISTLDYLINGVLSEYPLDKCHAFIRDRTRSIRQDFTLQNIRDLTAVQAHERIARFHILCLHEMCEFDESKFSEQQETEQLRKVLLSLMEFYDDLREEGIETENEPEFRAYHLISHIKDQDVARHSMTLPLHIFRHPYIARALEFFGLSQRNNEIMETSSRRNKASNVEASQNFYSQFFKLIADPGTPFLMACMLESHFSDVRKGALKAMNVSYMIKAGGVNAEHVRQVLAYDTVQHLLQEVHLYGIVIDLSLGEPTICFGQKHYRTKIPIFKEPLSNPSQKKSKLLVEPKKAGRSFHEIINGNNPYATPLPNQNVFARQTSLVQSHTRQSAFSSPPKPSTVMNQQSNAFNSSQSFHLPQKNLAEEEAQKAAEQSRKEMELGIAKKKAEAAAALATREREKMEALMAKKNADLAKQEEARQLKAQQEALSEQQKQLEIQKMRIEIENRERLAKQELLRKQQELEAQKREQLRIEQEKKRQAELKRRAIKKEVCTRMVDDILNAIIKEQTARALYKARKTRSIVKRRILPWLERSRSKINERNKHALEEKRMWHYRQCVVDNVSQYRSLHSTIEGIKERVQYSIEADRRILFDLNSPLNDNQESIWKKEDFSKLLYPKIKDKLHTNMNTDEKYAWQLLISVAEETSNSTEWFKRKFGLDDCFSRNVNHYPGCEITCRSVTQAYAMSSKLAYETGAIIFSLPESKAEKTSEEVSAYWNQQSQRFNKLIHDLQFYKPGIQVPVLFTYFPDEAPTEDILSKIPLYLGLSTNTAVKDYHFLIMNPFTIAQRIQEEVIWLGDSPNNNL